MLRHVTSPDGVRIACEVSGDGPPVVLVHGAGSARWSFAAVRPLLERSFTVIAIDRRGRGDSTDSEGYALEREYEDVAAVVRDAGDGATLVGHSYGGLVAAGAAGLLDELRRLALYEPPMGGVLADRGTIDRWYRLIWDGDREVMMREFFRTVAGYDAIASTRRRSAASLCLRCCSSGPKAPSGRCARQTRTRRPFPEPTRSPWRGTATARTSAGRSCSRTCSSGSSQPLGKLTDVTASLPFEVQQVFDRFLTTELVTVDDGGQPSCRAVTPRYEPGASCIDVSDADDALGGPVDAKVALLFCDAAGSGLDAPPQVLVQGIADVESRVRPERVYVWPDGDPTREPQLFDAHMEEVRSGHDEEPDADLADVEGGPGVWDRKLDELGDRHSDGVLSLVAPDGFPFSVRMPIAVDARTRRVRIASGMVGVPVTPGLACVTAESLEVHGDLLEEEGGWVVVPHQIRRDAN